MQGADPNASGEDLPGPPDGAEPVDALPDPQPTADTSSRIIESPQLPPTESAVPAEVPAPVEPTTGAETWYRTDQDRYRSVNRLANPWYRRLARGAIGMAFVAAAGVVLFLGAQLVQTWLERDRLPSEGAEVPSFRVTTIEIRSTVPAPVLDGTLTLDAETMSFEFVGRGTGSQSGIQVVSPDGDTTYFREGAGAWQASPQGNPVVADVIRAVEYLHDDDSADDILTRDLRKNYVDLIDQTEIGEGDDELRRYEMRFDTASLEANDPIGFKNFEDNAIPGVNAVRSLPVTVTLDHDDVLVAVDDSDTNWSWQRLAYSDQPFTPIDPAAELLTESIEVTDGSADG